VPISANETSLLRLLQLADSALPVGGSAHSYGLETLAQEGSLTPENLEYFLLEHLEETGGLDAAFVRRAWMRAELRSLSADYAARKPVRESREASLKMGRRLAELVNALVSGAAFESGLHYCIVFGAAGALFGVSQDATALAYLHQSAAGLVSACQRLMPLGQSAAATILWNVKPAIVRAGQREEVWCFSPFPELASMRHGLLATRLFIS
jgi:urease accessory protein